MLLAEPPTLMRDKVPTDKEAAPGLGGDVILRWRRMHRGGCEGGGGGERSGDGDRRGRGGGCKGGGALFLDKKITLAKSLPDLTLSSLTGHHLIPFPIPSHSRAIHSSPHTPTAIHSQAHLWCRRRRPSSPTRPSPEPPSSPAHARLMLPWFAAPSCSKP